MIDSNKYLMDPAQKLSQASFLVDVGANGEAVSPPWDWDKSRFIYLGRQQNETPRTILGYPCSWHAGSLFRVEFKDTTWEDVRAALRVLEGMHYSCFDLKRIPASLAVAQQELTA